MLNKALRHANYKWSHHTETRGTKTGRQRSHRCEAPFVQMSNCLHVVGVWQPRVSEAPRAGWHCARDGTALGMAPRAGWHCARAGAARLPHCSVKATSSPAAEQNTQHATNKHADARTHVPF